MRQRPSGRFGVDRDHSCRVVFPVCGTWHVRGVFRQLRPGLHSLFHLGPGNILVQFVAAKPAGGHCAWACRRNGGAQYLGRFSRAVCRAPPPAALRSGMAFLPTSHGWRLVFLFLLSRSRLPQPSWLTGPCDRRERERTIPGQPPPSQRSRWQSSDVWKAWRANLKDFDDLKRAERRGASRDGWS